MTVWAGLASLVNIERTALTIPLYGIIAFVLDDESREQQKFQALPPLSFHMHQKCAVTVGSPSLQIFKRDGRQKNGAGNRNNAVRIRETENRSDAGKRDNVFKAGEGPHICLHQEW
jgi:hypothetical protein